jgi:molybdate transport system ATP-binding protein
VMNGLKVDTLIKAGSFERAISFQAEPGITALVGPSGCGKTTTLNCIAGLFSPRCGRISFKNEIWFDADAGINLSPQSRKPGYVFQNVALFPHLSVAENVLFGVNSGADRSLKNDRVNQLAELFDLQELLARKPSQLSGGQAQRVALARALAPQPKLLLLDEPLNALDQKSRQDIAVKLRQIQQQQQLTIVLVTHFLDHNSTLADFVVELSAV